MTTTISDADIAAFQMIGQDIPWLLEHWADRTSPTTPSWSGSPRTATTARGPTASSSTT